MVREILDEAREEGITAVELLKDGFGKGMEELGEEFAEGEIFLPELIMAAEAMAIVTDRVDEELAESGAAGEKKGTICSQISFPATSSSPTETRPCTNTFSSGFRRFRYFS